MRLIIPVPFYRAGGVERVIVSLLSEVSQQIEQIILVMSAKNIAHFKKVLPESEAIVYEEFRLPKSAIESRAVGLLNRLSSLAGKANFDRLEKYFTGLTRDFRTRAIIKHLIGKYKASHCLYLLVNRLSPPKKLGIPLGAIAYDLFWRFAPLTYPESYIQEYDRSLLAWLKEADIVFTISERTRQDMISVFPGFDGKIKAVLLSGFLNYQIFSDLASEESETSIFYFPSSFGIYKDHLTLLKAGIQLAQRQLNFKVVLIGRETDTVFQGQIRLSQQSNTQEIRDYLDEFAQLVKEHQEVVDRHFAGLGYCDDKEVEKWYHDCACVVTPSKYEGFGLALSEAVVRGLPVIASDLDVFHEQVALYQCGDRVDFFPVGDADALADCMERFIRNPKPRLSGEDIQRRFSSWTWKDVAAKYVFYFSEYS